MWYACETVLKFSNALHQMRTFDSIMWVWLPYYCRLMSNFRLVVPPPLRTVVTQIQGHIVGSFPPHYGTVSSLFDSRRIVPTHSITGALGSRFHLRMENVLRRIEPMTPTLLLLFVLARHVTVLSTQRHQDTQCRPDHSSLRGSNAVTTDSDTEKHQADRKKEVKQTKWQHIGTRTQQTSQPRKEELEDEWKHRV